MFAKSPSRLRRSSCGTRCGAPGGVEGKLDVIFNPKYSIPLTARCKTVYVSHGLYWAALALPKPLTDYIVHGVLRPRYARKADAIIAVSETTRRHEIEYLGAEENRVHTVYLGVDETFRHDVPQAPWKTSGRPTGCPSVTSSIAARSTRRKTSAAFCAPMPRWVPRWNPPRRCRRASLALQRGAGAHRPAGHIGLGDSTGLIDGRRFRPFYRLQRRCSFLPVRSLPEPRRSRPWRSGCPVVDVRSIRDEGNRRSGGCPCGPRRYRQHRRRHPADRDGRSPAVGTHRKREKAGALFQLGEMRPGNVASPGGGCRPVILHVFTDPVLREHPNHAMKNRVFLLKVSMSVLITNSDCPVPEPQRCLVDSPQDPGPLPGVRLPDHHADRVFMAYKWKIR